MNDRQFTIERDVAAPQETVWRAWTDPDLMLLWWHPHNVETVDGSVIVDLRVGGEYRYTMRSAEFGDYPTMGTYLEIEAPRRLRLTWHDPKDAGKDDLPTITVTLEPISGDRTKMTFHMEGIANDSGSDSSVYDGWTEAFEELDEALADRPFGD